MQPTAGVNRPRDTARRTRERRNAFDRAGAAVYLGALPPGTSNMTTKPESNVGDLEKSLKELEALVERLESGDLALEEALKQFELGVKLTRSCQATLKQAEQRVEILLKKTEEAEPVPFEAEDED